MEQQSMFQRACWQMIHTLPHSCSTGTLAPRWGMDHLFSGLNFKLAVYIWFHIMVYGSHICLVSLVQLLGGLYMMHF